MKRIFVCAIFFCVLCTSCSTSQDISATPVDTSPPTPSNVIETVHPTPGSTKLPTLAPPTPFPTPTAMVEPTQLSSLSGHTVAVDPGHCVTTEKAREAVSPLSEEAKNVFGGGTSGKNQTEEHLNLSVALKLRDALESQGATVIMTREVSEITITGIERAKLCNAAEVCVRIHADGSNDSSVHGMSVLIPSGDLLGTPEIQKTSALLGSLMADAVAEKTGAKNRGAIKRSDLTGFNWSEIPVVLIEMGFMTNPEEDALMETEEYQEKIVDGIVESLITWVEQQGVA